MLGECVISSVLSHCSINLKWQASVMAQLQLSLNGGSVLQLCYTSVLFGMQKKTYPRGVRVGQKKERGSILAPLFLFFLLRLSLPCVNSIDRRAVCFIWGSHSSFQTFLCSILMGFSLLCLLAIIILDSFFLFYLPNRTICSL